MSLNRIANTSVGAIVRFEDAGRTKVKPAKPPNEDARVSALRKLGILDTAPEAAFDDIVTLASHICGTPVSMVSLIDTERQWFKSRVGVTDSETPRDISFCGHGILGTDLMVVADAHYDERFFDSPLVTGPPHVRFYAGAPLITRDGLALGMLCVVDREPRILEPWQVDSLRVLARQVMAQIELRQQNRDLGEAITQLETSQTALKKANTRLEDLATSDGLTGLRNHRVFHESLKLEFSRSVRYRSELSLIMVDVDHFKQYNDSFGHPEGDKVLKKVSSILAHNVRDVDVAARYGGEEFAIILPNTPQEGAAELGERMRAAIESGPWEVRPVTVSVGVATRTGDTVSAPALLAEADTALYHSKMTGRNRSTHLGELAPDAIPAEVPEPLWVRAAAKD